MTSQTVSQAKISARVATLDEWVNHEQFDRFVTEAAATLGYGITLDDEIVGGAYTYTVRPYKTHPGTREGEDELFCVHGSELVRDSVVIMRSVRLIYRGENAEEAGGMDYFSHFGYRTELMFHDVLGFLVLDKIRDNPLSKYDRPTQADIAEYLRFGDDTA